MVVVYQVGKTKQTGPCTNFQQYTRYTQHYGLQGSPRELFRTDSVNAVSSWLEHGDRIIIFINANEYILHGTLPTNLCRLGLQEATHVNWDGTEPRTYVHGNGAPINGVYHTPDLEIISVLQLFFHKGFGNHRTVIVKILTSSANKNFERRVVALKAQRLATKNTVSVKGYIKYVSTQCHQHKLQKHLDNLASRAQEGIFTSTNALTLDKLDVQKIKI